MAEDVTPTPEDMGRDLAADLAWALKQIRWDDQLWYGWAIAAQRRAIAAEAEVERLRAALRVVCDRALGCLCLRCVEDAATLADDAVAHVRQLQAELASLRGEACPTTSPAP